MLGTRGQGFRREEKTSVVAHLGRTDWIRERGRETTSLFSQSVTVTDAHAGFYPPTISYVELHNGICSRGKFIFFSKMIRNRVGRQLFFKYSCRVQKNQSIDFLFSPEPQGRKNQNIANDYLEVFQTYRRACLRACR